MQPSSQIKQWILPQIEKNSTLLDIGCGNKKYVAAFQSVCQKVTTVDAWEKVNPDILVDLEKTDITEAVQNEKFDYITMLDFIEHVDKSRGFELIEQAKQICNKKIFLLTPLEEIWDDNSHNVNNPKLWSYGNQYDHHKSLWFPEDFEGWTETSILKGYWIGHYDADV